MFNTTRKDLNQYNATAKAAVRLAKVIADGQFGNRHNGRNISDLRTIECLLNFSADLIEETRRDADCIEESAVPDIDNVEELKK